MKIFSCLPIIIESIYRNQPLHALLHYSVEIQQLLSIAIQSGNAIAISATAPSTKALDEIFRLFNLFCVIIAFCVPIFLVKPDCFCFRVNLLRFF